jgi:hypothetical protein
MASPDPLFSVFRLAYVAVGLLGSLWLWKRPRPAAALALVVGLNLAAWAVYVSPLQRPYAFNEHSDISFNIGMAACVAAGHSPFEHTQVGFANLEPFWSAVVAALAMFRPENVIGVYGLLSPLAILLVALGLYLGLRTGDDDADRWERVLIVVAVLGLSSISQSQRPPVPALWAANILQKPNHAVAWGLLGVVVGMRARAARPWRLGLVLGLMAWVFVLDWAFLVAGLAAGAFLQRRGERDLPGLIRAVGLAVLVAAPYLHHLTRDHSPFADAATPQQIWLDPLGQRLRSPQWVTVDLGLLVLLAAVGVVALRQRGTTRDRLLLGVVAAAWLAWAAYQAAAAYGVSPEPDEHHYYLRVTLALAAGAALAALARSVEAARGWRPGRGAVAVLAGCLPLTFPAYWDPPTMDRYHPYNLVPIPPRVTQYARWVLEHVSEDAVFVAGPSASTWIPALTGRRVLLAGLARPPADAAERKEAERTLLVSRDPERILETARRWGVTHLAVDAPMTDEYGADRLRGLGRVPVFDVIYWDRAIRIIAIREPLGQGRQRREVPDLGHVQEQGLEQELEPDHERHRRHHHRAGRRRDAGGGAEVPVIAAEDGAEAAQDQAQDPEHAARPEVQQEVLEDDPAHQ